MRYHWQTKRENLSHVDDWLMTYADMITLLLCFFAIFLSVSIPKKDGPKKVEITQPMPLPAGPTFPFLVGLENAHPLTDASVASIAIRIKTRGSPIEASDTSSHTVFKTRPFAESKIVDSLKSQGRADIEQKGDRITTLAISSAAFFDSGSATLSKAGEAILGDVTVDLKSDDLKDYQITVEGHTDDTPINTSRFPSNWELSTARASAVVHFFLDQGIPALKLRAAGYADTFPKVPNRDASGNAIPANQSQNRRVVIKMEKIDTAEHEPVTKLDAATFATSTAP